MNIMKKICKNCKYCKNNMCLSDKVIFKFKCDNMLIYWDADEYLVDFEVGENFGCIHFKEIILNLKK